MQRRRVRAVKAQAKRGETTQCMGLDLVTGGRLGQDSEKGQEG